MTETEEAAAVQAVAKAVARPLVRLHDEWVWIVAHSWSIRFIFIAFVLSCAEVFLPLLADKTSLPPMVFGSIVALVTGAAFVARLIAQKREGVSED